MSAAPRCICRRRRPRPICLGLVLQSRGAPLSDLVYAMRTLEPTCAATCADRPDRARTVLPKLRAVLNAGRAAINNPDALIKLSRDFHTVRVRDVATRR